MNRALSRRNWRISGGGALPLFLALVVLFLSNVSVALAQSPDLDRLDRFIARAQEEWPVPGLAVAIVKDGETVLARGYGVREVGTTDPVDAHTLFAIASNTKAFMRRPWPCWWMKGSYPGMTGSRTISPGSRSTIPG